MFVVDIPGREPVEIDHLVLDYNGTIALDGDLIPDVPEMMKELSTQLTIHVLTADTHGTVREKLKGLPCLLHVISPGHQSRAKLDYIQNLGCGRVAAIGNGMASADACGDIDIWSKITLVRNGVAFLVAIPASILIVGLSGGAF
jgi:soluble P-type ATPase